MSETNPNHLDENTEVSFSQKTSEIKQTIKDLEKKLEEIQNDCKHPCYRIKNCSNSGKQFNLKKVCEDCQQDLGFPNQDEVEDWTKTKN